MHKGFRVFVFAVAVLAQGRFEESKRLGLVYVRAGQFDRAAAKLEEVWDEQKPSDPVVAEHLALAYLNGDDRKTRGELYDRAVELMNKAIEGGGQATFLVHHSHERLGFVQGSNWTRYCRGRLSIRPGRLTYVSEAGDRPGEDSFEVDAAGVKEIKEPRGDRGVWQITLTPAGSRERGYNFAPRSPFAADSDALVRLLKTHLSAR
jgi:hypothetical protein